MSKGQCNNTDINDTDEGELPQYYVKEDHEPIISPWLFDYVQKRLKERSEITGRYSGVTVLSSKLKCGVCGSLYTPKPWHSTSYNNLVWQCRNRIKKGAKCPALNVYDRLLHFLLHDIARKVAFKRGVPQMLADIVTSIIGEGREVDVRQWINNFQKRSAWEMLSDEDDLAIVLQRITVMPNRKMKIRWLDGKKTTRHLPKYSPKGGIEYDDRQRKRNDTRTANKRTELQ